MRWFVLRETDHYVYWFEDDIVAKAFASLQARTHPNEKYKICCSVQDVWMGQAGVVFAMAPGAVRDGNADYHIHVGQPLKTDQHEKLVKARMTGTVEGFIDLMKPGAGGGMKSSVDRVKDDVLLLEKKADELPETVLNDLRYIRPNEKSDGPNYSKETDPEAEALGDVA